MVHVQTSVSGSAKGVEFGVPATTREEEKKKRRARGNELRCPRARNQKKNEGKQWRKEKNKHTHTHTHTEAHKGSEERGLNWSKVWFGRKDLLYST